MKILIIDDHQLYLDGMAAVLSHLFIGSSIFQANNIENAFDMLSQDSDIDIVLLDVRMPDGGAPTVQERLREENYAIPVLIISASENSADVQISLNNGALGYLPKSSASEELKIAIETVLEGNKYLPNSWYETLTTSENITNLSEENKISISPRLYEVLQLVEKGFTTPEISKLLKLSVHTVKGYIQELFLRFNVHNRMELIQTARQLHFFSLRN